MKRINQLKKAFVLFFTIVIAFTGCNDDLYQIHEHNHESNFTAKKLSSEEALQIARKLNGLVNKGKHNTLLISEQSVSVANNSVDFSTVNLIESINGTKTYAFAVNDNNIEDNIIKNVILQEFQNEIVVKEVSYNMTDSFKSQYYNGVTDFKSFQGTLTFETVFGNPCPDDANPVSIGSPIGDDGNSNGSGNNGGGFIPIGGLPSGNNNGGFNGANTSGSNGGNSGGGGTTFYYQCLNCSKAYNTPAQREASDCAAYDYIIVISFGQNQNAVPNNNPCDPSTTLPVAEIDFFNKAREFQRNLSPEQRLWTQQNPTTYNQILTYLRNENWSDESEVFAEELIDDMINFPTSEGNDGNASDFNYNDYSNIQTQTQTLPGRNAFYNAFPKMGTAGMLAPQVYQLIGGSIYNSHINDPITYGNACALRVSRALNYSGNPVPVFRNNAGQQRTQRGADNLNYILDAASMLAYMKKTFPNNSPLHLVNKTPTEYKTALNGKWGIYIMIPKNTTTFGATGHADFWSNTGCLSGCYFDKAKEIYFWELF